MMTSGADPALLEWLTRTQAAVERESAEISDEVRATEAEIAEENRIADETNEKFSRELDEQVEQRRAEQAADVARHPRHAQPVSQHTDHEFGFEDDEEFRDSASVTAQAAPAPQARHRRSPEPDFDDEEDFSKTNWLD